MKIVALLAVLIIGAIASPTNLKVAIYCSDGAASDKILATFAAVAALGHQPMGISHWDIWQGRLTRANFDVLILPSAEAEQAVGVQGDGKYNDAALAIGGSLAVNGIRNFISSGGGAIFVEQAARYASLAVGSGLGVFTGTYTANTPTRGFSAFTYSDSNFGSGTQSLFISGGGGYFVNAGTTSTIATCVTKGLTKPCIVRDTFGSGKIVLSTGDFGLRADSYSDFTYWDNDEYAGTQTNSIGAWSLLGRLIGYVYNGDSTAPTVNPLPISSGGKKVAIVADHNVNGGAWAGLLPAVARAVNDSGATPYAITFNTIARSKLTTTNFNVVVFPGGYAYGYKTYLAGQEPKIRSFVSGGGGYLGICAGGFYAPSTITWLGVNYAYPLQLYTGIENGPITDIAPDTFWALTPVVYNDATLGLSGTYSTMYYSGGFASLVAGASSVSTYGYTGSRHGSTETVKFTYGSGHVLLTGCHPESRSGSTQYDWLYWNNWMQNTTTAISSPDNTWDFYRAALAHWL